MQKSLQDVQREAGANIDGDVVRDFGNATDEYVAAQNDCAVFDMSRRCQVQLTGKDRAKFLHNFCTNNIKALQPGHGCEAFCTNVKGRVIGHIFVFCDEQSLWIETVEGGAESLIAHLDRYLITEDVQIHDRTAEYGELFVTGPKSAEYLSKLSINAGERALHGHVMAHIDDVPVVVRRVDWFCRAGYLLSVARPQLASLWQRLVAAGSKPAGQTAFEVLRIEAALPQFGVDITDDNLAQEVARTQQAISFTKGCYLGQEPIARIDAMGHVNRELRALRLTAGPLPVRGAVIVSPTDGKEIGTVTSSARLNGEQAPVALAYLRSNFVKPGTKVDIHIAEQTVAAEVIDSNVSTSS